MIHASNWKPRVYPVLGDLQDVEIDRAQDLTSTATLNRSKIEEIGRDGIVDWRALTPSISVTLKQLEYGSLEFWRKIANKGDSVSQINLTDFKTSTFDIAGYATDDSQSFLGTIWYPNLRMSGFGINIGDPDAIIERNFTFAGEDEIALLNNNKYLIRQRYVVASSGNNQTVAISNPTPVADPDNSGRFLFKVVKVSSGSASILDHGTGWSYNGSGTLTINGSSTAGDVIWVWFSAGSLGSQVTFVNNDSDLAAISADSCTILLVTSTHVSRLQSVALDVTFDRRDIKEIGTQGVVSRGVREITTKATLGRILETYTIEEVVRGVANQSYGKIDVSRLQDNFGLILKFYSDNTKSTFKLGYKFTDLAPTSRDEGVPVADYTSAGLTLEGTSGFITNVAGVL